MSRLLKEVWANALILGAAIAAFALTPWLIHKLPPLPSIDEDFIRGIVQVALLIIIYLILAAVVHMLRIIYILRRFYDPLVDFDGKYRSRFLRGGNEYFGFLR